ncbi:MAG: outer membrane protein assembly factor BamD [Thioalkalivibrio sp.]|nr:outer membrane protein assembly factor BamD [Thioalkalivibrio sp.]
MPDERSARAALADAVAREDCIGADAAMATLARHFSGAATTTRARLQAARTCIAADEPGRARHHTEVLVSGDAAFAQRDYAHYLHAIAGHGVWKQRHRTASSTPELLADVEAAREVVEDFAVLVARFPESRYRDEVLPYLVELHEGLARSELRIARLDLEQGEYERAAARAEYVAEYYSRTGSVEDARSVEEEALSRAATGPQEEVMVADRETGPAASRSVATAAPPAPAPAPVRPTPVEPTAMDIPTAPAERTAPTQSEPETQRRPAIAGATPDGSDWIRTQPRNAFTIQILGLAREQGVRDFLARHRLDRETAWFRTERNGSDWIVAIAGSYPNAEAARGAIAALPAEVRRNQPWIRSFGSVQDAMRGE